MTMMFGGRPGALPSDVERAGDSAATSARAVARNKNV
jgi:hypothetical protein